MTQVAHPLRVDERGRTAAVSEERHVRELVEQVLLTAPGERVNRPTFGSGLLQLVFAPAGDALAAAAQLTVQAALQQWLGELIEVEDVTVESDDSTLTTTVVYTIRRSGQRQVATFERAS